MNTLLNAAMLMLWVCGAAAFTVIRIGMSFVTANRSRNKTRMFSECLARVLGNSIGMDKSDSWIADSILFFIIGLFSTLTSILLTSALFLEILVLESLAQINTMAELHARNLTILREKGSLHVNGIPNDDNTSTRKIFSNTTSTMQFSHLEISPQFLVFVYR